MEEIAGVERRSNDAIGGSLAQASIEGREL